MASKVTGQEALLRRLKAIGEPRPLLRALQLQTIREAKLLVPRKTGNLGRSIVAGSVTTNSATVEARMGYAAHVEFGTKRHTITAKKGKSLFFPSQKATSERFGSNAKLKFNLSGRLSAGSVRKYGAGAFVHAKSVDHPGTKPQPYLVPGAKAALTKGGFRDTIVKNWNNAA